MEKHKDLTGDKLAKEVDKQPWDPGVKALTQFPAVLANMNQNLAWTSELGDAYVNQQQDSESGDSNHASAGPAGRKPEDHAPGDREPPRAIPSSFNRQRPTWCTYRNTIPGWCMGIRWLMFPGWYPYPGLFLGWSGSRYLDSVSGLDSSAASAGAGTTGDSIGITAVRAVYNHNTYISHSRTIVNRNSFHPSRRNFNQFGHGSVVPHASAGMHSGAFSGFNHGGIARGSCFRGQSSFGGFHGGGGGGFHGGGGGFHGGGGGRR